MSEHVRNYKYRLYPTPEAETCLSNILFQARCLYNDMIVYHRNIRDLKLRVLGYTWAYDAEQKKRIYAPHEPTREDWNTVTVQFKKDVKQQLWKDAGFQYLRQYAYGESLVTEHTAGYLMDRIVAGHEMYRTKRDQGDKEVRRPHKTKGADDFNSVRYTLNRGIRFEALNRAWGKITITHQRQVYCEASVRLHRPFPAESEVSTVTIYRARRGKVTHDEAGHFVSEVGGEWYAIFAVRTPADEPEHTCAGQIAGIDMGLVNLVTAWDGEQETRHVGIDFYERSHRKRRKLQRRLSRGKKDEQGRLLPARFQTQYWHDTKRQLSKLDAEVARRREYDLHVLSRQLVERYAVIALEDISPQFMLRGKKLARRAANAAWAKFVTMLEYKAKETGTRLVYINPAYTSQTCSACGHVDKENRVTQAEFICQACGLIEHADVNAAKNIFAKTVELIHA